MSMAKMVGAAYFGGLASIASLARIHHGALLRRRVLIVLVGAERPAA